MLNEILRRQAGVITTAQAAQAGLSEQAVRRRVYSGAWRRLHPGVYLVGGHPQTDEVLVRAAVAAAGEGAVAHGLTAAWWQDMLPRLPAVLDVTVPRHRRAPTLPGVCIRRRDLHRNDVDRFRNLPVTTPALTALEAAVLAPEGSVLLDRWLQQHVSLPMLRRVHRRNLGRHGAQAAARLLDAAGDGAASQAERLLHRLLRRAGITGWHPAYSWRGFEIDVAFPGQCVAVEVDGWAFHSDAASQRRDHQRQNVLVNGGWRVLRFTWHDLTGQPERVITDIRAALALREQLGHRFDR